MDLDSSIITALGHLLPSSSNRNTWGKPSLFLELVEEHWASSSRDKNNLCWSLGEICEPREPICCPGRVFSLCHWQSQLFGVVFSQSERLRQKIQLNPWMLRVANLVLCLFPLSRHGMTLGCHIPVHPGALCSAAAPLWGTARLFPASALFWEDFSPEIGIQKEQQGGNPLFAPFKPQPASSCFACMQVCTAHLTESQTLLEGLLESCFGLSWQRKPLCLFPALLRESQGFDVFSRFHVWFPYSLIGFPYSWFHALGQSCSILPSEGTAGQGMLVLGGTQITSWVPQSLLSQRRKI